MDVFVSRRGPPSLSALLRKACRAAGQTFDFMLSKRRDTAAATKFFAKALSNNGIPLRIVIDKSGANGAGIKEVKKIFKRLGCPVKISTVRSKYLNNMIEHPFRDIAAQYPVGQWTIVSSSGEPGQCLASMPLNLPHGRLKELRLLR